jgi:hypothetical protein
MDQRSGVRDQEIRSIPNYFLTTAQNAITALITDAIAEISARNPKPRLSNSTFGFNDSVLQLVVRGAGCSTR